MNAKVDEKRSTDKVQQQRWNKFICHGREEINTSSCTLWLNRMWEMNERFLQKTHSNIVWQSANVKHCSVHITTIWYVNFGFSIRFMRIFSLAFIYTCHSLSTLAVSMRYICMCVYGKCAYLIWFVEIHN